MSDTNSPFDQIVRTLDNVELHILRHMDGAKDEVLTRGDVVKLFAEARRTTMDQRDRMIRVMSSRLLGFSL